MVHLRELKFTLDDSLAIGAVLVLWFILARGCVFWQDSLFNCAVSILWLASLACGFGFLVRSRRLQFLVGGSLSRDAVLGRGLASFWCSFYSKAHSSLMQSFFAMVHSKRGMFCLHGSLFRDAVLYEGFTSFLNSSFSKVHSGTVQFTSKGSFAS
jgi:hypothetical protein